jgi:hypothetical protein
VLTHNADVPTRLVGDRVMLLDQDAQTLLTLNPAGTVVWLALEQPSSVDDVVGELRQRWPTVDDARLRVDAEKLIAELVEIGALVEA